MAERTCYEVASGVSDALNRRFQGTDLYVLGGIATGALADPESEVSPNRVILPSAASDLPLVRANGTRRDIDILAFSSDPEEISDMTAVAKIEAADDLEVAVFGLDEARDHSKRRQRAVSTAARYWTSRREIDNDGVIRHVLFPFSAEVPMSAFEAWNIIPPTEAAPIPVLEPYYHVLSYDLRSIGGPRPKDQEKLGKLRRETKELLTSEQKAAYGGLDGMVEDIIELRHQTLEDMLGQGTMTLSLKARLAHFGEGQTWVVDFFQRPGMQRLLRPFVGNGKEK